MKIKNRTTLLRLLERLRADPNVELKLLRGGKYNFLPYIRKGEGYDDDFFSFSFSGFCFFYQHLETYEKKKK